MVTTMTGGEKYSPAKKSKEAPPGGDHSGEEKDEDKERTGKNRKKKKNKDKDEK